MRHTSTAVEPSATPSHCRGYSRREGSEERLAEPGASHRPRPRPDALWRSGDYFALAMNYSAVANHVVNLTVRVYSHIPVSSLNKHKNKNCISAHRSPDCSVIRERG